MIIIKNFLPKNVFTKMQSELMSNNFPWFFNDGVNEDIDSHFQFTHVFYNKNSNLKINSEYIKILEPLLNKIQYKELVRIKANLLVKTKFNYEFDMHTDYENEKYTTAIYYINSNNGYTIFKNSEKIFSEENKIVFFPANILHAGATCSNNKRRVLINLNFIK